MFFRKISNDLNGHVVIFQITVIFTLTAMGTSDLSQPIYFIEDESHKKNVKRNFEFTPAVVHNPMRCSENTICN
jgi:hypothetical protein